MSDKTAFDHVSDWFRILLKGGGIPALLIGLGWITVFFGAIPIGSAWAVNAGFWVATGTGLLMIALGYHGYRKAVESVWSEPSHGNPRTGKDDDLRSRDVRHSNAKKGKEPGREDPA